MTKKSETTAKAGHNSVAHEEIKSIVARIERLEEEKSGLGADIKEIYAEAKSKGLNTKTLRKVIARKKLDASERDEQDALLALYEGVFA